MKTTVGTIQTKKIVEKKVATLHAAPKSLGARPENVFPYNLYATAKMIAEMLLC